MSGYGAGTVAGLLSQNKITPGKTERSPSSYNCTNRILYILATAKGDVDRFPRVERKCVLGEIWPAFSLSNVFNTKWEETCRKRSEAGISA